MANTERPEGQPPAAWVWSQYRGVATADSPTAESHAEAPADAADTPKSPAAIGLGLVAAILVIAGLTWLFTTKPASEPAAPEIPAPASTEAPAEPQKSEAAPTPEPQPEPAAAPPPVSAPAPTAAAQEPAKPAATPPAPSPHHGDKKKKHR